MKYIRLVITMVLLGVTAVSQTAADVTSDDISQALRKNLNHPSPFPSTRIAVSRS